MFKYSKLDYDKFYSSEHCKAENEGILAVLNSVCRDGELILDLGAGTGLVSALIGHRCPVLQVEKDADMQAQNPYRNFIADDALHFLKTVAENSVEHVVSVFALNYMHHTVIEEALRVAKGACVFVLYDKPYLRGSDSFYAGRKLYFLLKHWLRQRKINRELAKMVNLGKNLKQFNLLGQPYYRVVVLR